MKAPLTAGRVLGDRTKLLIVQPAVPAYRVAFFDKLIQQLRALGVDTLVVTGGYEHEERADKTQNPWSVQVPDRLADRFQRVRWRRWSAAAHRPDLVVAEQAIKNLESYPLLARQRLGGPRVAMWGHGRSYSTSQGPAAAALKQFLTRRCDWFFAYTQAGADHVVQHGFPRTRVSVLNNTINTETLEADLARITTDDVEAFQRRHALTTGRTALFLGGVDAAKGIDFLLQSARAAERLLPGFVLLVGGAGQDLPKVQAAQAAGAPVRALGRLDGIEKALALRTADVLAIPEWIGLVAVDSLVAGRPIVSTNHPSHSPEHEYLTPGVTAVFADHEVGAYATAMTDLLGAVAHLRAMQSRCREDADQYTLDRMVDSFTEGVLAWDEIRRAGL